jgi:hypothetical protein
MTSVVIDLVQPLMEQAKTIKQKESCVLRAHALVQWLFTYHFPSKIRKSGLPLSVSSPHRGKISMQLTESKEGTDVSSSDSALDGPEWEKGVFQALKKIVAEDLGPMNASELQSSIPPTDSEGRGMADLQSLEKKLSIRVVFDVDETDHVLLVGDEKKLEKKVFVIRNMLSHYHWRLSGSDVAFDKATSTR